MKKSLLLTLAVFSCFFTFSQTLSNQLLGYQEPYTQINSQVVDSSGNTYYAGTFKGALIINNQTVFNGNGGDDVFIVKTSATGNVIWAKKIGDSGNQSGGNITLHHGSLYLSMIIAQTSIIEGITYTSYATGVATSLIAKLDTTAGNFIWLRKHSMPASIVASGNILYLHGTLNPLTSNSLYFENNLLQEYSADLRLMFLYLDTSGNYLGNKLLTSFSTGTIISIISPYAQPDGKLVFLLNALSAPNIKFGSLTFNLPVRTNYHILIKGDTSSNFKYKILNPSGEGYTQNLYAENTGFSMNSSRDSIYLILGGNNAANYKLDGFDVPVGDQSVLLVLDSSFKSARLTPLNVHRMYGIPYRTTITHVAVDSQNYYFKGRVTGNNSSIPRMGFPEQKVELELLFGLKDSVNINGVSKSFLIKTTKDIQSPVLKWLGDHTLYESPFLSTATFSLQKSKLHFFHFMDNVWNPWIVDSSLTIVKGSMKANADRAETTNYVKYLSDGSKILVGTAKGRTALDKDSANVIINGQLKNDLFFLLLGKSEQVIWYKRMTHSFGAVSIQKIVTQNDNLYCSFVVNLPRNSGASNYIQIDTSTFFITPATPLTSCIIVINRNGKVNLLQLQAPFNTANVFAVFPDGDLAVASLLTGSALTIPGKSFPGFNGVYVGRFDPSGVIKDAVKFTAGPGGTTLLNATDIIMDGSLYGFKMIAPISIAAGYATNSFVFINGSGPAVSFPVANPKPTATTNKSYFLVTSSNFSDLKTNALIGPANSTAKSTATIKNKHYLLFAKANLKDSIYYNKTLIIPDDNNNVRFILNVDTSLKYYRHKVISSSNDLNSDVILSNLVTDGSKIYASGSSFATTKIDTIQIGNGGLTDAITIQFDTSLVAKRLFRLSSPYHEQMYGCDTYMDTLISFAYTTQGTPSYTNNRIAARNTTIEESDLDEDAYLQTVLLKTNIITSVDEPLRIEGFKLFPNPVLSNTVTVDLGNTDAGRYHWLLYNTEGKLVESNLLMWNPGQTKQIQFSNRLQTGNYVLVIKTGQQKTLKAVKLTIL